MGEQIQILLDFYNLRLAPKVTRKSPGMKLSRRQQNNLKHFLEESAVICFEEDPDLVKYFQDFQERVNRENAERLGVPYELHKQVLEREMPFLSRKHEQPITKTLDLSEGTPYRPTMHWFESQDFVELLDDHERVTQIVDRYLETQTVSRADLNWLNTLGKKLLRGDLVAVNSEGYETKKDYIDLKTYRIKPGGRNSDLWHSLAIAEIGIAIHQGLVSLLNSDVKIKRCTYSKCRKIFLPSSHGSVQKFCSKSCRVMASQNRQVINA